MRSPCKQIARLESPVWNRAADRRFHRRIRGRLLFLLGLGPLMLAGCSNDPRLAVSGTVRFNGQPLDQGRIEFHPPGGKGSLSGTGIHDGRYHIPQANGLAPATYEVKIFSYDTKGAKVAGDMPGEPGKGFKERIARKYNLATELRADVKPGTTTFDFSVD